MYCLYTFTKDYSRREVFNLSVRRRPNIANTGYLQVLTLPSPTLLQCRCSSRPVHVHNHPLYESPALFIIDNRDTLSFDLKPASLCRNHIGCHSFCSTFKPFLCFPMKKPMFLFQRNVAVFPDFSHNLVVHHIIVADSGKGRC